MIFVLEILKKKIYCTCCNNLLSSVCGTSKNGEPYLYYKCKNEKSKISMKKILW